MNTVNHYNEAAKIWGNIDPNDDKEVERFYVEVFSTLDYKTQGEIIEYLLCNDSNAHGPNYKVHLDDH